LLRSAGQEATQSLMRRRRRGDAPVVSFVVPCYNLAHLLGECVESILAQSYQDFEVLVMDDCSPDNTGEVTRAFADGRVMYVRNDQNQGHLRNYNKGIGLSRGKYIWLISADDYLRRPYVLQRYVEVLEAHPEVGYVFCDGVGVTGGVETGRLTSSLHGDRDRICEGHDFLRTLLRWNSVLAPAGMARRECYEMTKGFPLDLPWAGDWYLWCVFALHWNVAYLAEPMVCYRAHELSMTHKLTRNKLDACASEDIAVPWLVRSRAQEAGYMKVVEECIDGIAHSYVRVLTAELYRGSSAHMNVESFEASLSGYARCDADRERVRAMVWAGLGNECYWRNELECARRYYRAALDIDPRLWAVRVKMGLLSLGWAGDCIRKALRT
jgi:Glycosyl transferase family 2